MECVVDYLVMTGVHSCHHDRCQTDPNMHAPTLCCFASNVLRHPWLMSCVCTNQHIGPPCHSFYSALLMPAGPHWQGQLHSLLWNCLCQAAIRTRSAPILQAWRRQCANQPGCSGPVIQVPFFCYSPTELGSHLEQACFNLVLECTVTLLCIY